MEEEGELQEEEEEGVFEEEELEEEGVFEEEELEEEGVFEEENENIESEILLEGEPQLLLEEDLGFVESATWDKENKVFLFTDIPADKIYKFDPETMEVNEFMVGQNLYANGLTFDNTGNLLMTAGRNILGFKVESDEETSNIALVDKLKIETNSDGLNFNSPNDVVTDSNGNIYFTDPDFNGVSDTGINGVYKVDTDGVVTLIQEGGEPNGLVLSEDGDILYTVDSMDGSLKQYNLMDEEITATELFRFPMGGDGLAIDSESHLYAALGDNTVRVMDIEGNEKQVLYFDARPTSITFGGEDMKTVLITTETKVFTIPANVEGVQLEEVQKKRDADLNEEEELPLLEEEELADHDDDILPSEEGELEDLDVTEEEELPLEVRDGDVLEEELEDLDVIEEKEELPLLKEEELEDLDVTEEEELPLEVRDGDVLEEEEL